MAEVSMGLSRALQPKGFRMLRDESCSVLTLLKDLAIRSESVKERKPERWLRLISTAESPAIDSRASPSRPALENLAGAPGDAIKVDSREVRRVSAYPPHVSSLPLHHQKRTASGTQVSE